MKPHIIFYLFLVFAMPLWADFQVAVVATESTPSKSVVKIKARNNFDQNVKAARAWVFLMDDQGKVVGQNAQWIIGGDSSDGPQESEGRKTGAPLEPEKEAEYSIAVNHSSQGANPPTQTKITFSRIILADGTLVNPHKSVEALEENADGQQKP